MSTDENGFTKHDDDKGCTPTLVPVEFRAGLRLAVYSVNGENSSLARVLTHVEAYEVNVKPAFHPLLVAGYHLQRVCESNFDGSFLMGMAKVMALGAVKYSPDNWRKCAYEKRFRYLDAFYRHVWPVSTGNILDPESGLNHLYHAGCCLAMCHGVDITHKPHARGKEGNR